VGVVVSAFPRPGDDPLIRCALTVFPLFDEVYPAGGRRPTVVFCPLVVSPPSPALSNCSVDLRLRGLSHPRLADSPTSPTCPPHTPTCRLPPAVIYLPPPLATSFPCNPILCVWLAWCRLGAYSSRRTTSKVAMPPPARRYVALATRAHCVLHDVVGDEVLNTLSEYLHRLPSHEVLVAEVFASDVDALRWVTNLLSHEGMGNCCASTPASRADGKHHGDWYGAVEKLSFAAFDVGRGGLGCAFSAVATVGAELSVVRRFASLAITVDWLADSEAPDILTVMSTAHGAPATGTLDGEPPFGATFGRDRPATVEASTPALGTLGCASLTTATDCRRTFGQGGRAALPLVAPVGCAASGAPASGLSPLGVPGAGGGARVPSADPSLGQGGGEGDCVVMVKVEPAAKVGTSAAPWPEATVKAETPRVADTCTLDNTEGPPEALNPPQSWSDKAESTFSRSAIHKMMEKTRVFYDRVFLEQALKTQHAVAGISTGHVARKAKSPTVCVRV